MNTKSKNYRFMGRSRKSARLSLFGVFILFFVSIMIFTFTPVKAVSFNKKLPCCSTSAEGGNYDLFSGKASLSESCTCCGAICRCNFREGIPVNDTELNISPRSTYHGDEPAVVSQRENISIEYDTPVDWRDSLLVDYGESVPLYLLKSSLLFYH